MNFLNFFYLFFRLAPFVIVCFFSLQSILNNDLKGVIYLVGLLIASMVTVSLGKLFSNDSNYTPQAMCNTITLGDGGATLSALPLSQTVFGYTLFYLFRFISEYNLYSQNTATLLLFPTLAICDGLWNWYYSCLGDKSKTTYKVLAAFIIGSLIGGVWGSIIISTKMPGIQYLSGISNKDVCNRPTKGMFRCRKAKK